MYLSQEKSKDLEQVMFWDKISPGLTKARLE